MRNLILVVLMTLAIPVGALAVEGTSATTVDEVSTRMPSAFRLGLLGSYVMTPLRSGYENTVGTDKTAGFLALMAGTGRGMLSLEAGVGVLKTADVVILADHRYLVSSQYYAFPVWAKFNYIERSLASFFVKAGVMPVTLFAKESAIGGIETDTNSMLAIVGIGGTAALTNSLAFVLDITGFQNLGGPEKFGTENRGIPKTFVTVGAGLSFDL